MSEDTHPERTETRTAAGKRRGKPERGLVKPPASDVKPEGQLREKLLRAALTLFTRRGYSATTVRELVAAAGVTKPVLYYYFVSKEGLFLELMRTHFGRLEAVVDVHRRGEGSVRDRLTAMLERGFDHIRQDRDFVRLMHAVYFGPPDDAPYFNFEAYHQRYHDLITRFIEEGIEKGEFRSGNAGDMAWVVLGTMEIAVEDQIARQTPRIDGETLRRLLDLVFYGFAAAKDQGREKK